MITETRLRIHANIRLVSKVKIMIGLIMRAMSSVALRMTLRMSGRMLAWPRVCEIQVQNDSSIIDDARRRSHAWDVKAHQRANRVYCLAIPWGPA